MKIRARDRGQASNQIVVGMITFLMVGFLGIVSVTIYDGINTSMAATLSSSTSSAAVTLGNYSERVFDGYDLTSNIPIILAAGMLLAVIIGFALYVKG